MRTTTRGVQMNEPQDLPDERRRDDSLVLLADRMLREPEIVRWLAGDDDGEDEPPRAA
jgi:hypothetical protein